MTPTTFFFTDPFGNQTKNYGDPSGQSLQTQAISDPRGVRTSFTYQLQNNGATWSRASRRRVTTPGPAGDSLRSCTTTTTR